MQKNTIKDWATDDQPRQKLLHKGAENLSDSELLAILINNGIPGKSALELAKDLLRQCNHDLNTMGRLSVQSLCKLKIKGLGQAKAIHITAALELGLRRHLSHVKKEVIKSSRDIADYLRAKLGHKSKEVFGVLFLNRSNKVIAFEHMSEGGITGTVVDIRVILKKALLHESVSMVICHNHPSGNLDPSTADELITKKIKEASLLLNIRLLDHIIVSNEGHYSFADHGKL